MLGLLLSDLHSPSVLYIIEDISVCLCELGVSECVCILNRRLNHANLRN